jgi:hypothetical protein
MKFKTLIAACAITLVGSSVMANPNFWQREWPDTDFSKTNIEDWREIMSGGPAKDGIPALNDPSFIAVSEESRLGDREPVITVEIDGAVPRTYPIRYLIQHEIINDVIGDVPVAVTYCPLCNSGLVFDRRVNGELRTFGVSGKLRNSDMVMFDRETESWWQQAVGLGIVGEHTGDMLLQLPAWMESWDEFKTRNPDGLVMGEPNWPWRYGRNPYVGYDTSRRPFLYSGEQPPHGIPSLARVVRVGARAWTLERLREEIVITEAGVTISWTAGQASALDSSNIGEGRDVGTIRVKDADGVDVPHDMLFAFAFDAFWPDGEWMLGN